jgi:hypothetical protein
MTYEEAKQKADDLSYSLRSTDYDKEGVFINPKNDVGGCLWFVFAAPSDYNESQKYVKEIHGENKNETEVAAAFGNIGFDVWLMLERKDEYSIWRWFRASDYYNI